MFFLSHHTSKLDPAHGFLQSSHTQTRPCPWVLSVITHTNPTLSMGSSSHYTYKLDPVHGFFQSPHMLTRPCPWFLSVTPHVNPTLPIGSFSHHACKPDPVHGFFQSSRIQIPPSALIPEVVTQAKLTPYMGFIHHTNKLGIYFKYVYYILNIAFPPPNIDITAFRNQIRSCNHFR